MAGVIVENMPAVRPGIYVAQCLSWKPVTSKQRRELLHRQETHAHRISRALPCKQDINGDKCFSLLCFFRHTGVTTETNVLEYRIKNKEAVITILKGAGQPSGAASPGAEWKLISYECISQWIIIKIKKTGKRAAVSCHTYKTRNQLKEQRASLWNAECQLASETTGSTLPWKCWANPKPRPQRAAPPQKPISTLIICVLLRIPSSACCSCLLLGLWSL